MIKNDVYCCVVKKVHEMCERVMRKNGDCYDI